MWADQIPRFLDEVALPSRPPVLLLHTEVMRQHLLAAEGPEGAWRLSGLIDFEPAMRGEREYEFVSVGVFVAEGDGRFLTRTLTAYGYRRDQFGADLRRQLLAWGILHRYNNLTWWMRRLPEPTRPTLDAVTTDLAEITTALRAAPRAALCRIKPYIDQGGSAALQRRAELCRFGSACWLEERHGSPSDQRSARDSNAADFLAARLSQSRPPRQGRASCVADAIGIRRPWTRHSLNRDWQLLGTRGQSSGQLRGVASSRQRNLTTSRDPVAPPHPARQPRGLSIPGT